LGKKRQYFRKNASPLLIGYFVDTDLVSRCTACRGQLYTHVSVRSVCCTPNYLIVHYTLHPVHRSWKGLSPTDQQLTAHDRTALLFL
jgi:hypothetical protein